MGSAGSGKSYAISQKLIIRCLSEPIRVIVCRRTGATLRNTCFSLFTEILKKWKIYQYCKVRQSDLHIDFPNGSEIIFMGLDEETKLLSLSNISVIWVEEAFEVPREIVEQLNLRMRGTAKNQQIILSFNPISKDSWLYDFCNNPPSSFSFHHSTYKDNPFLDAAYVATLEELYERNPQKARIFCDGEWGIDSEGLVFQNWKVEDFDVMAIAENTEHRAGLDFGYVDETAIISSLYDSKKKIIYIIDEWVKSGAQLDAIANAAKDMKLSKTLLYCDSAEPRSIEALRRSGLNAKACIKGQGSVNARIAFLQNHQIIVHSKCQHVIKDLSNFAYLKDKKTDKYTNDTTHEYSHTIDALGYSYSNIYHSGGMKSLNKSVLGL